MTIDDHRQALAQAHVRRIQKGLERDRFIRPARIGQSAGDNNEPIERPAIIIWKGDQPDRCGPLEARYVHQPGLQGAGVDRHDALNPREIRGDSQWRPCSGCEHIAESRLLVVATLGCDERLLGRERHDGDRHAAGDEQRNGRHLPPQSPQIA